MRACVRAWPCSNHPIQPNLSERAHHQQRQEQISYAEVRTNSRLAKSLPVDLASSPPALTCLLHLQGLQESRAQDAAGIGCWRHGLGRRGLVSLRSSRGTLRLHAFGKGQGGTLEMGAQGDGCGQVP